ncbi:MAG: hypothetical protein J1F71_04490 [Clostridiales bacterium]|nr:hypothetical protein [Clostridiales bacterium]
MNKKFEGLFSGYGMTVEGNFAYGTVNGYETNATVIMMDAVAPLRMHISFYATDDQKRAIEAAIRNLTLKFFRMRFSPYGLSLGFNDITANRLIKSLPETLNKIYGVLADNGALNGEYCPVSGKRLDESNSKKCKIDGYTVTMDSDCSEKIDTVKSAEKQDFDSAPNNYLKGFLGAFIGGLVGAVVSVILYAIGFVSSLAAIISVILGAFLYQKFGGKPNKMMIVIVSLTSLVMQAATVPIIYIAAAGIAASAEGFSMSALEAFKVLMGNDEFARWFYADLAMVVLFSALGTGLAVYSLAKKKKNSSSVFSPF